MTDCGLRKFMARSYNYLLLGYHDDHPGLGDVSTCKQLLDFNLKLPGLRRNSCKFLRGIISDGQADLVHPSLDMVCDYHAYGEDDACEFKSKNFRDKHINKASWSISDKLLVICCYLRHFQLATWFFVAVYVTGTSQGLPLSSISLSKFCQLLGFADFRQP